MNVWYGQRYKTNKRKWISFKKCYFHVHVRFNWICKIFQVNFNVFFLFAWTLFHFATICVSEICWSMNEWVCTITMSLFPHSLSSSSLAPPCQCTVCKHLHWYVLYIHALIHSYSLKCLCAPCLGQHLLHSFTYNLNA